MSNINTGIGRGSAAGIAALAFMAGRSTAPRTAEANTTAPTPGGTLIDIGSIPQGPSVHLGSTAPSAPMLDSVWIKTTVTAAVEKVYKNPYADMTGGTVHALAASAGNSGFTLLSTAPVGQGYAGAGHAAAAWDEVNQQMFIFGADTHGSPSDNSNAVYAFSAVDGKVRRSYAPDNISTYTCSAAGLLTSGSAKNRPWASHVFPGGISFNSNTREIEVVFDAQQHAYLDSVITAVGVAVEARLAPLWYYNVDTGAWRYVDTPAVTQFIKQIPTGSGVVRLGDGSWVSIYAPWIRKLSADRASYSTENLPNLNPNIQSFDHRFGNVIVSLGGTDGGGATAPFPNIGAVQYLDEPAKNEVIVAADHPALNGWNPRNLWSVKSGDSRVSFAAQNAEGVIGVFHFDYLANTVVDTGHRLPVTSDHQSYELKACWSEALGAGVICVGRLGSPHKFYLWRP